MPSNLSSIPQTVPCAGCGRLCRVVNTWTETYYCTMACRNAMAARKPQTRFVEHATMPKVTDDYLRAQLDARVLDPKRRPNVGGRKTELELYGMAGTPRRASKRHAFNKKSVQRSKPRLDYIPPETERSYQQEVERVVGLETILEASQGAAKFKTAATDALDAWEKETFAR